MTPTSKKASILRVCHAADDSLSTHLPQQTLSLTSMIHTMEYEFPRGFWQTESRLSWKWSHDTAPFCNTPCLHLVSCLCQFLWQDFCASSCCTTAFAKFAVNTRTWLKSPIIMRSPLHPCYMATQMHRWVLLTVVRSWWLFLMFWWISHSGLRLHGCKRCCCCCNSRAQEIQE